MAIFSPLTIQKIIDENTTFLTKDQIAKHLYRLNGKSFDSIATEWEVVILNVFSKIGHVEHEPNLGSSKKLDLLFTHNFDHSKFAADITTISDEGYEKETPLKAFEIEFRHHIKNAGLQLNGFGYSVDAHQATGPKIKLMLPNRELFSTEIFNIQFKTFLRMIKQEPTKASSHHISTNKTRIVISYDPGKKGFCGSSFVYALAISKTKNLLYYALRDKWRKQLKTIEFSGPKVIIVCDGGSHIFHAKDSGKYHPYFNAAEIITEFLRQNQSIAFVIVISVSCTKRALNRINAKGPIRNVKVGIFPNENSDAQFQNLLGSLSTIETLFPEPCNTPDGARETLRQGLRPKKGHRGTCDDEKDEKTKGTYIN